MNTKKYISLMIALATLGSLALAVPAFAQTPPGAQNGGRFGRGMMNKNRPQTSPAFQGNGQPVVAGKVASISGSSITITNSSNVTYTIDAVNAKFVVGGVTTPTISNVAVGDNLVVQGTVNGNAVVSSTIIDQKPKPTINPGPNANNRGFMGGMMNGIGNFFKRMFGF